MEEGSSVAATAVDFFTALDKEFINIDKVQDEVFYYKVVSKSCLG